MVCGCLADSGGRSHGRRTGGAHLVSIWFAPSAAVTVLISLTGVPFVIQPAVLVLAGYIALLLSRPLARRFQPAHKTRTNADGVQGVVSEEEADKWTRSGKRLELVRAQ